MKLVCYTPDQKDVWNNFIKDAKNGLFMFERDYMDYHADRFQDHSLMVYDENNRLIAVLPANKKEAVLHSHQGLTFGGFVYGTAMKAGVMLNIFQSLKTYLNDHGFNALIYKAIPYIYHNYPAQEDLYALFRNEARSFRVDITTTIALENRLGFSDLRKRGVKKAHKAGVTIHQSQNYTGFMDVLSAVLHARHGLKPVHSSDEILILAGRFPENIKLFTAEKDGAILAGTLIFEYPHIAHAQYIACAPEGQDVGALDAVFDYLINTHYTHKKYFNFGVSSEDAGRHLNEGLIHQKEGFGGRAIIHEFFEMSA